VVLALLCLLLPPQADNQQATDYLRTQIGQKTPLFEWVVVRPDSLIDAGQVSPYTLHPSPTRSAIFDPGMTSRVNVAHCMAELITNGKTWTGKMPVFYNQT